MKWAVSTEGICDFMNIKKAIAKLKEQDDLGNTYLITYKYIIDFKYDYKKDKDILNCLFAVYSWTPSALILHVNKKKDFFIELIKSELKYIIALEKKKDYGSMIVHFENLTEIIDNSSIGVSKFLHFFFPDKFPIFDSKILKNLRGIGNSPVGYIKYLSLIDKNLESQKEYISVFKTEFKKNYNYEISDIRACELILFLNA